MLGLNSNTEFLLFCFIAISSEFANAGATFVSLSPILTPRRGSVGAVMNGNFDLLELWVVGGSNSEISDIDVGKLVEIYQPVTDKWIKGVDMPNSRSDHGAVALNNSLLFVAGGMSGCWNPSGSNVCNVSSVDMFVSQAALLGIGGKYYDKIQNEYKESVGGSWEEMPAMNVARRGLALAADDAHGLVYAVGGMNCNDNCYGLPVEYLATVEVFSVETQEWTFLPPMQVGRRDLGATVLNGKLYAVGGCGGNGSQLDYKHCEALDTVEVYDPLSKQWSYATSLLTPRHGFALTSYGSNQLLAAGGSSADGIDAADAQQQLTRTVDSYDLSSETWFSIAEMPDPRDGLSKGPGLLIGNSVYLVSGSTQDDDYVDTHEMLNLYC